MNCVPYGCIAKNRGFKTLKRMSGYCMWHMVDSNPGNALRYETLCVRVIPGRISAQWPCHSIWKAEGRVASHLRQVTEALSTSVLRAPKGNKAEWNVSALSELARGLLSWWWIYVPSITEASPWLRLYTSLPPSPMVIFSFWLYLWLLG